VAESFVNVTEGSGKKLHTFQRTIGANTVEDELVIPGEHYLATYVVTAGGISTATVGDDAMQIMAGASTIVRIRRIRIEQDGLVTAAAISTWSVGRLTTAGTGGTAITPQKLDSADGAAASTAAFAVPNATHGTIAATYHFRRSLFLVQTAPVGGLGQVYSEWLAMPGGKPLIIAAGTTNGVAVRNQTARAGGSISIEIEYTESSFV
jgi:hypothetical protein